MGKINVQQCGKERKKCKKNNNNATTVNLCVLEKGKRSPTRIIYYKKKTRIRYLLMPTTYALIIF